MEEVLDKKEALFMLSESHYLDKAFELFKISYREEEWDKADGIADYIYEKSNKLYQQHIFRTAAHQAVDTPPRRPLVFYYAYSYLAKALVYQKKGLYERAKEYIAKYSDMSWFRGLDEDGLEEVEKFHFWAKANTFAVDLISGNHRILSDYVQFLIDNPEEILPGMVTIMEAANQNDWNVDYILHQFSQDIESFATLEENNNQLFV